MNSFSWASKNADYSHYKAGKNQDTPIVFVLKKSHSKIWANFQLEVNYFKN